MTESKVTPPSREMIRQTLIELLEADTGEKHPDLDEGTNLREGLGLDSVDVVSIVSQIERRFRIRLTHEELQTLVTVKDVLNLLENKLKEAPAESKEGESTTKAA
jgi:acyl carrier protein